MSGHTEGKWIYKKSTYGDGFAVFSGSTQITIGGCGCCSDRDESIDSEEDARLIAAAPELYEVAQAIIDAMTADSDLYGILLAGIAPRARAAIAKATGDTT